jgi:enterochelin esterase-like enzyme
MSVLLVALGLLVVGLSGAYSYWEAYYQHRGFAPVALIRGARPGRLVAVNFESEALRRSADYLAYLPPGYDPLTHRYPVYYLLHGSPGRPKVFIDIASIGTRLDNLIAEHRMRPMILVMPDGRIDDNTYSDSEWANTQSGRYDSYVLDVVHDVDQRYATIPKRQDRVIAGFSAGAYGATNIALHNLDVFGSLQAWSGYYLETHNGVFAHASPAVMAYNSPLDYVRRLGRKLRRYPFRAFLFIGRDDNLSPQTEPMANALAAGGASVSYALYHGGHDWELWHAHLNQMLMLASRDASHPLRRARGPARTLTPGVIPIPHGTGNHRHRHRRSAERRSRRRPRRRPPGLLIPPAAPPSAAPVVSTPLIAGLVPGVGFPRRGSPSARSASRSSQLGLGALLGGLLLALVSAALINVGFLLQHRGLAGRSGDGLLSLIRGAARNPTWLTGQAVGWVGFGAQIVAVVIAPLSLVQAFAAGGLALSVPLAAVAFSYRVTRAQLTAVLLIAGGLAVLPIGFSTARDHLHSGRLGLAVAAAALVAAAVAAGRVAPLRAIAAGAFYGIADAAIKAISLGWHANGPSAIVSVWTLVAAAATFGGFLAFQSALRDGGAVSAISLMNALAALVALACGQIAFSESLGANPVAVLSHVAAIGVVLGCVPTLAAAQSAMATGQDEPGSRGAARRPTVRPGYETPG